VQLPDGLAAQHPLQHIGASASGRLDHQDGSSSFLGLLLGLSPPDKPVLLHVGEDSLLFICERTSIGVL
jgi:hypothetical protein